jgi:L-asparaginase
MTTSKKLLLIATGGTIASARQEDSLAPTFGAEELLSHLPEVTKLCPIDSTLLMNIDSTNMTPADVGKIGQTVNDNYQEYDGFIITHGTNTLGYTAALLTYQLQQIKKPVVLTGSQLPIAWKGTDARSNIETAVRFALEGVPGVFVSFAGRIIRGTRAVKTKSKSFKAFESINSLPVASIKDGTVIYQSSEVEADKYKAANISRTESFSFQPELCSEVFLLKLHPGLNKEVFAFIKSNYQGVVIEAFGLGDIPAQKGYNLAEKVEDLLAEDIAVVIVTQCKEEGVELGRYQVSRRLAEHPKVINGGDLTTEAALGKLMWGLAHYEDYQSLKSFLEQPIFKDRSE